MSNDAVYSQGLLNKALDPASQPRDLLGPCELRPLGDVAYVARC